MLSSAFEQGRQAKIGNGIFPVGDDLPDGRQFRVFLYS
jgi:hypothetical protein